LSKIQKIYPQKLHNSTVAKKSLNFTFNQKSNILRLSKNSHKCKIFHIYSKNHRFSHLFTLIKIIKILHQKLLPQNFQPPLYNQLFIAHKVGIKQDESAEKPVARVHPKKSRPSAKPGRESGFYVRDDFSPTSVIPCSWMLVCLLVMLKERGEVIDWRELSNY
jgi:hypothetical protein